MSLPQTNTQSAELQKNWVHYKLEKTGGNDWAARLRVCATALLACMERALRPLHRAIKTPRLERACSTSTYTTLQGSDPLPHCTQLG
eukprot:27344-Amphidinium_carterae.1